MRRRTSVIGIIVMAVLGVSGGNAVRAADEAAAARRGPLKDLPSKPTGEHLAKVKALGDNQWVNLGSPAPDPKWGKAAGRSWAPRMAYAPDMRGAFFTGEGPHGRVKSNGYGMDDVWFYDANQHRWICVYPGTPARGGYKEVISIDPETGFEVDKDGNPVPVAVGVHAYMQVTYDTDRKCFMRTTCGSYLGAKIKGRKEAREAYKEAKKKEEEAPEGDKEDRPEKNYKSPWIYSTVEHRWERYRCEKPHKRFKISGFGSTLVYVPSVEKAFAFRKRSYAFGWYNPEKREWSVIKRKGEAPPWDMDSNSCYDSKRDRIYMGGGIYPVIEKGKSALYAFDVQSEKFIHLKPEKDPGLQTYSSNNAMFFYDSANDAAVLFMHDSSKKNGTGPGIYAYHPEENRWETVAEKPGAYDVKMINPHWSGYYDPELNAHLMYVATDGRANGTMWAYRYKRKK
ncbi:MAG: hypothetical protein R6V58_08005 [Planctomycetota bacterium]